MMPPTSTSLKDRALFPSSLDFSLLFRYLRSDSFSRYYLSFIEAIRTFVGVIHVGLLDRGLFQLSSDCVCEKSMGMLGDMVGVCSGRRERL